jgi:hypothetical protein
MAGARLTEKIKKYIAVASVKGVFMPSLHECWKTVEVQFTDLVKDIFKDFDWEHIEPYREFINWHDKIHLCCIPGEWEIQWDEFRRVCNLPPITCIELSFKYPSQDSSRGYLDNAYKKHAEDILRPYMIKYLTAKKYYKDVQQILLSLSTYKQLEETVPELMEYLPKTAIEPTTALIPIEQISRVRNLLQKETV